MRKFSSDRRGNKPSVSEKCRVPDDGRQPPLPPQIDGEADVPGSMKYYLLSHVAENMPLETPDALAVNNGTNDDESSKSVGINVEFIKLDSESSRLLQSILNRTPSRKRKKMTMQLLDSPNHLSFDPPDEDCVKTERHLLKKKKKRKKAPGKNKEIEGEEVWKRNNIDFMPNEDDEWNEGDFRNSNRGMDFWQSLRREFYFFGWQFSPKWLASLVYVSKPRLVHKYLYTDLRETSKPILPPGGGGAFSQITKQHINYLVLQIEEIEDMTGYMTQWFPDQVSLGRQYRVLSLTDGLNHVLGFEYESLWDGVTPGVKVALHVKNILREGINEGFLKLCRFKNFAYEGGIVEVNATQVNNKLADSVKDPEFQDRLKKAYEQWRKQPGTN